MGDHTDIEWSDATWNPTTATSTLVRRTECRGAVRPAPGVATTGRGSDMAEDTSPNQGATRRSVGAQPGPRNTNWKGGRSVASNGYVLVKLPGHHLADTRGYVYEHRLVAEEKLGRCLGPGEQVHHIDHNKQNNDPANLEVKSSRAQHALEHRKRSDLRRPGQADPFVYCECGCGSTFAQFDGAGRPRRFVSGHNLGRQSVS